MIESYRMVTLNHIRRAAKAAGVIMYESEWYLGVYFAVTGWMNALGWLIQYLWFRYDDVGDTQ